MSVGLAHVLFTGAALFATGAFATAYRRDLGAALTGLPIMAAGAGLVLVGVTRFAAAAKDPLSGQEFAVVLAIAALLSVLLGAGLAGREGPR